MKVCVEALLLRYKKRPLKELRYKKRPLKECACVVKVCVEALLLRYKKRPLQELVGVHYFDAMWRCAVRPVPAMLLGYAVVSSWDTRPLVTSV